MLLSQEQNSDVSAMPPSSGEMQLEVPEALVFGSCFSGHISRVLQTFPRAYITQRNSIHMFNIILFDDDDDDDDKLDFSVKCSSWP